jgi:pyruvate dehydrogenase E2 component (dihydrolipoamide acetyltransferase)
MAVEFKLPDLGESIEGGEILEVLVAVGDTLTEDQPVVELETDKAVIEVPSSVSGTINTLLVSKGDHVKVGQLLLSVEGGAEVGDKAPVAATPEPVQKAEAAPPAPEEVEAGPAALIQFALPDLGESVEGGTVIEVLVSTGDSVEEDQPLIELETDKAVVPVPAPTAGTIGQVYVKAGDQATIGQLLLDLQTSGDVPAAAKTTAAPTPTATPAVPSTETTSTAAAAPAAAPATKSGKPVPAAPSVRRLAREIGIDIAQVPGTGPGGRISTSDVKLFARSLNQNRPAAPTSGPAAGPAQQPLPDFSKWGEVELQPMSNVRRITAERLHYAWSTIPQVTQFDKADITDLEVLRKQYGKRVEAAGGKLTPTAILLKILGAALKAFPQFNTSIDMEQRQVIYKRYVNIGIAVDTEHGLLVPVVRDVDRKNVIELAIELGEIAKKARDRKIAPADMQGGCITISNVGVMGGTGFTPIVNPPEVAILGVARSAQEAVYIDGQFQPRLMMPLSLSYDHRQIDGADGARFLRWVCEAMQNPFLLMLEG